MTQFCIVLKEKTTTADFPLILHVIKNQLRKVSRGPRVTRGRRISLTFQSPHAFLREGHVPLGVSLHPQPHHLSLFPVIGDW